MKPPKSKVKLVMILAAAAWLTTLLLSAGTPWYEEDGPRGRLSATLPSGDRLILPLKHTRITLDVTAGIVSAQVTQTFQNNTSFPLEAVYVFPLPSESTVTDMTVKTGNRIIRSVVKERQLAKRTYEKAKSEGKKTALIEQERPNIFTTSLANLLPSETVEIQFEFSMIADYRKGIYELTYPMTIGPRYIPRNSCRTGEDSISHTDSVPDAHRITPPILAPWIDPGHRCEFEVLINGIAVKEITSSTHVIRLHRQENGCVRITLAEEIAIPDRDFSMKIHLMKKEEPHMTFVTSRSGEEYYGLFTVFPPLKGKNLEAKFPREVIFLIDTSGSMGGRSIGQAKSGLKKCLEMLRSQDTFNIVRFSSSYSSFSPAMRSATPEMVEAALGYIESLTAGGGTEMQRALEHVLSLPPDPGKMRMIVFMTDGCIGNEDSLMRLLHEKLGRARIFAFGIGSAPNEFMLKKLGELGRGQTRWISSHEDIGSVLSDFFRTVSSPVLTDVSVQFVDMEDNPVRNITLYPNLLQDVFFERPLQLTAHFPEKFEGKILISGTMNGKKYDYDYYLSTSSPDRHPALEKVHARARIDELMFRLIRVKPGESLDRIREEIISTAIQHGLVTRFTSRVAVEEVVTTSPEGQLLTVSVPGLLPYGWDPRGFVATATSDPLLLIIGSWLLSVGFLILFIEIKWVRSRKEIRL